MSFHIITVNNLKNYFHSFVFFFLMAKKGAMEKYGFSCQKELIDVLGECSLGQVTGFSESRFRSWTLGMTAPVFQDLGLGKIP